MSEDEVGPDPSNPDEPTQAYDPVEAHEPDSEELALSALSGGFGDDAPAAAADHDADLALDAPEMRSMLAAGGPTGKAGDTELALATVTSTSRTRMVRDRVAIAGVAAALLLLVVFVAAWDRSSPSSDLETANDRRSPGTTSAPGTTARGGVTYSGDPDAGTVVGPDTTVGPVVLPPATDFTTTTINRASTTSTVRNGGPDPSTPSANPPVLQVNIHADASAVNVGDRVWFNVQVHNSGGQGMYEGNTCSAGTHFKLTVAPALPSGGTGGVPWDGSPSTFAAAVGKGGGGMVNGPIAGGDAVGAVVVNIYCPMYSIQKPLAPGETLSERVAIDLTPPPGQPLTGTRTVTAEFATGEVKASDSTTITVGGATPALPDATALQAVATSSAVAGWVAAQSKPFIVQSRYYRGAWELILSSEGVTPTTEVLRVRVSPAGSILDVRAAQNRSAFSDDPGATAPVVGERVL